MFNKQGKLKLIAASLGLVASVGASAAMGGLQVQSRLDEPFSATVVVTGDEARALAGSTKPTVIGANLTATVTQQGNDRAVVRLASSTPMKEPVVTFWLGVGNQNRQYTAMLDPRDYRAQTTAAAPAQRQGAASAERRTNRQQAAEQPRRRAEQRERSRQRVTTQSGRVEVVTGQSYQVKDGELLVHIAERVQPSGMTLRQTINALVRANPKAFRNGNPDLMYRGATLIIPEAAQMRRLAQDGSIRVRQQAGSEAPPPEQNTTPMPGTTPPVAQTTPPAEPAVPTEPAPVAPPAQASLPVEPQPASAPVEAVVSEPVAASEAVSEPVAMPIAEEPAPQPPAQPVEPVPAVGGGMDMSQMALYGAGGLAVLGGLAYLLSKRRRTPAVAAPAAGTVAAVAADDDDLFFEDISAQQPAQNLSQDAAAGAVVAEEDLGLDLSHLAEQQHLGNTPDTETVASVSQQQDVDEDWGWLEDSSEETAKSAQVPATAALAAGAAVVAGSVAAAEKADDDWLNFGEETVAETALVQEDVAEAADDFAWLTDEELAQTALEAAAVDQPNETVVAETDSMDFAGFDLSEPTVDTALNLSTAEPELAAAVSIPVAELASEPEPVVNVDTETEEATAWAESMQETVAALPQEALEAKLELAKMYLEIDDANTARHTLTELINESNGSPIQAQAQALLNELG